MYGIILSTALVLPVWCGLAAVALGGLLQHGLSA